MFADAYEKYGSVLAENVPVLIAGNILVGQEGARINVKECYHLDAQVTRSIKKVTWLLNPGHRFVPEFLHELRETVIGASGDTAIEIGFLFEDRVATIAEASTALSWRLSAERFQKLRAHTAVAGVQLETRPLELKQERRWGSKR
jgi:DNA polymerase-3 subunit alpha